MKWTIRKKLLSGFLSIAVILGIISSFTYYQIQRINDSNADLINRRTAILSLSNKLQNFASRDISSIRAVLLKEDGAMDSLQTAIRNTESSIGKLQLLDMNSDEQQSVQKMNDLNKEFKKQTDKGLALFEKDPEAAQKLFLEVAFPIARDIRSLADSMADAEQKLLTDEGTKNTNLVHAVNNMVLISSAVAFLMAIVIGIYFSRAITKPIFALAAGAENIASGYIGEEDIKVKNKDEFGQLAQSFNQMKNNLRELIQEVGLNSSKVSSTSASFSASAEQTSKATELIAVSIQEIAEGVEKQVASTIMAADAATEISKGMGEAAASFQLVADLTTSASDKAITGEQVVTQAINQMNLIKDSTNETSKAVNALGEKSEEISQIVNMITKISAQTNILALNASIEAARAGEHGRGFAVVASEVRNLAEQTGGAASQVRELIEEVQVEVQQAVESMESGIVIVDGGIEMVNLSGQAFAAISDSIQQVTAESQELSAIVEQVNSSSQSMLGMMENISAVAQYSSNNTQNVASSSEEQTAAMQEVSASAETLNQMASELQESISKFRVQ